MSDKHMCTMCWANGKKIEAVSVMEWEGYTYPGRGKNICSTYLCQSCRDSAEFAVGLSSEHKLVIIKSLEKK